MIVNFTFTFNLEMVKKYGSLINTVISQMVFSPASRLWRLAVENTFVDAANKMLVSNILLAASEEKSHNSEPPKARCWRDFNY